MRFGIGILVLALLLELTPAHAQFSSAAGSRGPAPAPSPNPITKVIDAVGSAGVAYGTIRLSSTYTGKSVQLTRISDNATQDLGFLGNGNIDAATGDAFCQATTCFFTTLYDQSGNGNNCTTTTANAPIWSASNTIAGRRAIVFNSNANSLTNMPLVQAYCSFPNVSWNTNTVTWIAAGFIRNSKEDVRDIWGVSGNGNGSWVVSWNHGGLDLTGTGAFCPNATEGQPTVFGAFATSSAWTCNITDTIGSVSANVNAAQTGGVLGMNSSSQPANQDLIAFVMWPSTLSAQSYQNAQQALIQQTGLPAQYTDAIMVVGDSMSDGQGSTLDNSWSKLVLPSLNRPVKLYNTSLFGVTAGTQSTNFSSDATGIYNATFRNFIVIILVGANDIRAGTLVSTIETSLQSIISSAHSLGSNAKVLIATYPLQCDVFNNSTWKTNLQTLNTFISGLTLGGGGSNPDGLIDFFGNATIGPGNYLSSNFCSNTANSPDGQHPTDSFMSVYSSVATTPINNILQ